MNEQQILAEQLRKYQAQAQTQAPQGRMAGRVYVAPNPLEYLAAGLRGVGGMRGEQQTQQAMTDLQAKRQAAMQEALRGFGQTMQGTPYNPGTQGLEEFGRASIPEQAAKPGDPMAAYQQLLGSEVPELQKIGMQGMVAMPEMQARQQERADNRAFQAAQADEARKARADQLTAAAQARAEQTQLAHQLRMDQLAAQNASREQMAQAQREFQAQQLQAQQDFQREMKKIGGAAASQQPYFQPVQTAQGVFAFNARTGKVEPVTGPGGAPIVGAAADPALQGQIAGAKAGSAETAKGRAAAAMDAPNAIAQGDEAIKLVDDLLKAPGMKQAVGASRLLGIQKVPGTAAKDFDIRLDQLKGKQFLQAFESLKGGGAITEMEGKKATDAIARMDAAGSEEEFVKAAREFQGVIRRGVEVAKTRAGGATAPAAAPPAPKRIRLGRSRERHPMIEAELPDGTILEFPDGTTPDVMRAAVQRMQKPKADAPTFGSMMKDELMRPVRAVRDLAAGAMRGAGSIGATLLAPKDAAESFIARQMGAPELQAPERRNAMTEALQGMGADPDSMAFGAGKIGAEIAGTAGVGGALARGAQGLGAAPAVVNALRSGGMSTGGRGAADLALRTGAGATVGATSAGMVNPEDAGLGGAIGGVMPGAIGAAGWVGSKAGQAIYQAMTPEMQKQAAALAQATGRSIDEVVSALRQQGPSMIPGSAKTTPQILQNETVSQVARNLQNKGNFGLVEAEKANAAARIAALERVAPTAGTINEARANAGNAIVDYAKGAEKSAAQRVRNLFDAVESQDDVRLFLPIDQMEAARSKFLGRGSFGAGGGPADQAINTAKEIGTTTLDAVKAAPMQKQQSLYEAVLSAGGIHKNSPSGRQLLGELKDLAASKQKAVVRANSGKSADLLAQEMHARGFIPDEDPATLIQYLKDAGRDTFATDANMAGQYARRAEAAMGDLPGAEVLPKAVPFQEMQNLRSSIGEAAQTAKVAGNKQAAAALSEMKRSIDAKINAVVNGGALPGETFSQESANLYRKALAEHAAKKAQFNTGPQAAIFRTGSDGLPAKEGAEVAPLFWNSGNAQIENMQAFKRLTKEDQSLVKLMKSNATTEALQSSAKGPQGAMTFDAFNKWMKNHAGAAKELFSDQELATLKSIGDELRNATKAENLGRATGSNTAQNIMSNGILDNPRAQAIAQSLPMGVGKFVTGPLFNYARASGETARNTALAQLLADPELMGQQLRMYSQGRAPSALIEALKNPQLQQLGARAAPVISAQ